MLSSVSSPHIGGGAQKVFDVLSGRIRVGGYAPGEKLPTERELVEEFGVGRSIVRQALSKLNAEGLAVSRQGAGVFALSPVQTDEAVGFFSGQLSSVIDAAKAHEIRMSVEIGAARLAAQRCSPAQKVDLHARFHDLKMKIEAGESFFSEDAAFHLAVAEASQNSDIVDFLILIGQTAVSNAPFNNAKEILVSYEYEVLEEHQEIMLAIINGEPDRAADAMERHLSRTIERYLSLLRGYSEKE